MYFYLLIFTEGRAGGGGAVHRLPKRVGILRRFCLKTDVDFTQFGLE